MHSKKSKYKTSYFTGKLESASNASTGEFQIGDRVKKSHTNKLGVIITLTKSNFGKGRPIAVITWDDGSQSKEPLGRLKHESS